MGVLLEAAMEKGVEARFEVDGGSMLPLIRPRDCVAAGFRADSLVRTGDVAVVRPRGQHKVLVHRVVASDGSRPGLQGDNCRTPDGTFSPEDIIGIVTRVERNGRSIWFGAGRLGPLVAFAVRHGLIWRANRLYFGLRRHAGRALKFLGADSRLPAQKGDDGNE